MLAILACLFLVTAHATSSPSTPKEQGNARAFLADFNPSDSSQDLSDISTLKSSLTSASDIGSEAMQKAITDLLLGKSAFGATPMGGSVKQISNIITKSMMPKVLSAHKSDQRTLKRMAKAVERCGSVKNANLGSEAFFQALPSLQSSSPKMSRGRGGQAGIKDQLRQVTKRKV